MALSEHCIWHHASPSLMRSHLLTRQLRTVKPRAQKQTDTTCRAHAAQPFSLLFRNQSKAAEIRTGADHHDLVLVTVLLVVVRAKLTTRALPCVSTATCHQGTPYLADGNDGYHA